VLTLTALVLVHLKHVSTAIESSVLTGACPTTRLLGAFPPLSETNAASSLGSEGNS